jgi:hypothetical protein
MAEASNEARRASRAKVILEAAIEHEGCSIPVKVSNVSASGALVIGDCLPGEGSEVVFRRHELAIAGRIAWVDSNHAGLEFDATLQVGDLLRHVQQLRLVSQPSYRRPGLKSG